MRRRQRSFLIALLLSALSLQGCMTLVGRKAQHVTVTARPAGARILVDGEFEGVTPLALRLAKKPPHVIRIEKEGYRPVEIRLMKRKLWFPILLGNLLWIPPVAMWGLNPDAQGPGQVFATYFFPILSLAVYAGAVALDASSPKGTVLDPIHLSIFLEKDSGGGGPVVMLMAPAEFRNITWISVLADGGAARR
ncbi:MAG: PEGA domain-containing protein [Candidatus Aminicenantes bacterium]|nr:PEGA domain-containing protein [Candidatus Aminicenantes bacterium]